MGSRGGRNTALITHTIVMNNRRGMRDGWDKIDRERKGHTHSAASGIDPPSTQQKAAPILVHYKVHHEKTHETVQRDNKQTKIVSQK